VLAVPGIKPGSVHIENYDLKTTQIIHAHTKYGVRRVRSEESEEKGEEEKSVRRRCERRV
jgi:hypothetical protein